MKRPLIEFVRHLRKSGIQVSPAELLDAGHALTHLSLESRSEFKDALRTTMIKRVRDIPIFDALFDLHFPSGPLLGGPDHTQHSNLVDESLTSIGEILDMRGSDLLPAIELMLTGRSGALTRLLLESLRSLPIHRMELPPIRGSAFIQQLRRDVGLDQLRMETDGLWPQIDGGHEDNQQLKGFRDLIQSNLALLDKQVADSVYREVAKKRFLEGRRLDEEELARMNLFQFSEKDLVAIRPVVDRLARRLKDRLSQRLKRDDVGRFDLKTTLRRNIGFGGPLPDPRFRHKKPARPQVVAICDVSRSVRNFSRFMLLFLYTLKEVVARVRSFIFVGDLTEVTRVFQEHRLEEAVSLAAAGSGLRYPFGTDYGSSLTQFADHFLGAVNSKTTVIVLGDARNNNLPTCVEALEKIAHRARKLIWLNPESPLTWNLGDSVMGLYSPYCSTLTECGTLEQLAHAVECNLLP